jgi:hypothetical protein
VRNVGGEHLFGETSSVSGSATELRSLLDRLRTNIKAERAIVAVLAGQIEDKDG